MGEYLRRGCVAGLVAGAATGIFLLLVGEPFIETALSYEAAASDPAAVELFSRTTQIRGMLVGALLYGLALGGLFGLLYGMVGLRMRAETPWDRSLRLAVSCFVSAWLVPFLKYPSNPPGVGDTATIALRTILYLSMIAVSIASWASAAAIARKLEQRGVARHVRQSAAAVLYLGIIAAAFLLLPANPDPVGIPAELLWKVRLTSAGGQALLWTALGAVFGWLSVRTEPLSASPARLRGPAGTKEFGVEEAI